MSDVRASLLGKWNERHSEFREWSIFCEVDGFGEVLERSNVNWGFKEDFNI